MSLRPPQIEQRDENGRGSRLAPPDDIRHELFEITMLLVHHVGENKDVRTRFFSGPKLESVSGRVRSSVDNVICDVDVSRIV